MKAILATVALATTLGFGGMAESKEYALTGVEAAQSLNLKPIYHRSDLGLVLIELNDEIRKDISRHMHDHGKCGGYEVVELNQFRTLSAPFRASEQKQLDALFQHMEKPSAKLLNVRLFSLPQFSETTAALVAEVSPDRLRDDVAWISAYPTRYHKSTNKNAHVEELKRRLEAMITDGGRKMNHVKIEFVDHARTQQKSLRATITGSEKSAEIVALGAHYDSINQSAWTGQTDAPGADDDASGSANLIEIFRILVKEAQPKRTVQFFWYAAEEVGLYGSSEIANDYKNRNADVVSVMQLDMTLFPGSGVFTIGVITDFTNAWLNSYLIELNRLYTKAKITETQCGYACSDHASWHRQGYPATFPFESDFDTYNKDIHTVNDKISSKVDFEHSAVFARLGLAYALSLANSDHRSPKP